MVIVAVAMDDVRLWFITVGWTRICELGVIVGLVGVVVRWVMIDVLLRLITVGRTPVHGLRAVTVGSMRLVDRWVMIDVLLWLITVG